MHISRNVALEGLIRGDIAAIGMNLTHLQRARQAYPDIPFRVIARGRDLPNDILLAGRHVPQETVERVRQAFAEHGPALLEAMLVGEDNQKFAGGQFIPTISDADYDYVRSMYRTIGRPELSQFVGE